MKKIFFGLLILFFSCNDEVKKNEIKEVIHKNDRVSLVILGTIQDAGSPHVACKKECCSMLFDKPDSTRKIVSLGLVDAKSRKTFLLEATPDITSQVKILKKSASWKANELPNGIFITHAHIGHYSGLMYLGKEATNAKEVSTYIMPKMKYFLENNGPWGQLVSDKNIALKELENRKAVQLTQSLAIVPFTVPHRDEYSETVGYKIIGPNKTALFLPDIDKWGKWDENIIEAIVKVDLAFLDATFYDKEEINNRDISEIPHPFVVESMALFKNLPASEKEKVHFIHFNHTNPLLNSDSSQAQEVLRAGFNIAKINDRIEL